MLIESPGIRNYLFTALEGAPEIFSYLLRELSDEEADFRPDPTRFSIREVMAHLADWETIFLERLQRTSAEHEPFLPDLDEGQLVLDHDYAHTNPIVQWRVFAERRAQTVAWVRSLSPAHWGRFCVHERAGRLTLEALSLLISLHDSYHLRQVTQWRCGYAEGQR